MAESGQPILEPLTSRIGLNVELVMPDRRKRDIDNYLKVLLDAVKYGMVFEDDEQIDEIRVKRLHIEPPGCVDLTITELTPTGE